MYLSGFDPFPMFERTFSATVQPLRHKAFGKPFGLERLRAERLRP